MIYICAGLLALAGWQGYIILSLVKRGDTERRAVEMKLLAVLNPPAAVHVESLGEQPSGSVTYMDDTAMAEWEEKRGLKNRAQT